MVLHRSRSPVLERFRLDLSRRHSPTYRLPSELGRLLGAAPPYQSDKHSSRMADRICHVWLYASMGHRRHSRNNEPKQHRFSLFLYGLDGRRLDHRFSHGQHRLGSWRRSSYPSDYWTVEEDDQLRLGLFSLAA